MTIRMILISLLLACGQGLAAGRLTAEQIAQLRAETQQRRVDFFAKESGKPLVRKPIKKDWNNRGDFTRHYAQSIVLFSMRACELNEQLDEANAALQELCQYHLDRPQTFFEIHSFPGACDALARLYIFYGPRGTKAPNRLSAETCAILEKTMWEWANEKADIEDAELVQSQTWWITDSENHHAQHFTTCWAFSRILRNVPGYKDKPFKDGHLPVEHYEAWTTYLKEYLRQRACKGTFIEIDSMSYATATLKSMVNFYDFSDDLVLKKRAGQMLELYWALWAEQQIDAAKELLKQQFDAGADFAIGCYDVGFNEGPFISPDQFQEFVTPYLTEIVDSVHALDKKILMHSDGNINELLDQIHSTGIDGYQSVDPQGHMDIKEVRERFPDWLLMGNVNCSMLQGCNEADIRESVQYAMKHGGLGKRFIFSTSNCIFPGMPPESYRFMLDEYKKQCKQDH